jgi:hypothetical protein
MLLLKNRWLLLSIVSLVSVLVVVKVQQFCHKRTDGFSLNKIQSKLSYHPQWALPHPPEKDLQEIKSLLAQKFFYLAKGAQCHVFVSEDQKYVIKFFRHHHMRPPSWIALIPSTFETFRKKKENRKWGKLHKDFNSYHLAFTQLKEQTGLIFLHLNKSSHLKHQLTIVDKIGIEQKIDLDQMEFILQKRADLVYPAIDHWMQKNNTTSAEDALSNLVSLLHLRLKKGLFDKDPDLNTNFGFIGTQAVQIDIGRFKKATEPMTPKQEKDTIIRITDNLKQYLDSHYPELSGKLEGEIEKL